MKIIAVQFRIWIIILETKLTGSILVWFMNSCMLCVYFFSIITMRRNIFSALHVLNMQQLSNHYPSYNRNFLVLF